MEQFISEVRKQEWYRKVRKNPLLWGLLTFLINDIIIKGAKDLLDDGKLNGSAK